MSTLSKNSEILYSFIDASTPIIEEIEEIITLLRNDPNSTILLNSYFRLLYTLKGTAQCVGLKNIPIFVQSYGELIGKLQWQQTELTPAVLESLMRGLDHLKAMYAEARLGNFEPNPDIGNGFEIHTLSAAKNNNISELNDHTNNEKISISINILDKFMDLSGQFTMLRNTLTKSATELELRYNGDKEVEVMVDSLTEMHKVSNSLQTHISDMRKVGIDGIYNSIRRIVKDSASALSKLVVLKTEGDQLRIDTSINKILSNALVHMVRNSIDHGIELPDQRAQLGKNTTGTIIIKSFEDGDKIFVEISDDGAGLSLPRIKQKALDKGLFTETQLTQMTDQRLYSIIFEPGFSTAQIISDISGSGEGMDVVQSSIAKIGGKILIESKDGAGAKFKLSLPIPKSVLIIKSLMVKFSDGIFSIPLEEVAEVVCLSNFKDSKVLHHIEGSLILRHHDELLPLVDLAKVMGNTNSLAKEEVLNVVIVRSAGYKYGIIVDKILDIQEIVVKELSEQFKDTEYFMGVTFVGHGELALILDLGRIAIKVDLKVVENVNLSDSNFIVDLKSTTMEFMQFNFKNSKNYAFPLSIVNRLEEIKTNTIEFTGSIPIVHYRNESLPLLFIERQLAMCPATDTLLSYYPDLVKVIVVNLHNKIFGIVVQEILDIGITSEQVETDSIDRQGFMGTIFIANKTISILDINFLIENYLDFEHAIAEAEFTENNVEEDWHTNKVA